MKLFYPLQKGRMLASTRWHLEIIKIKSRRDHAPYQGVSRGPNQCRRFLPKPPLDNRLKLLIGALSETYFPKQIASNLCPNT
jgi:hypothetical protein